MQQTLFTDAIKFGGTTYVPIHDEKRLQSQLERIKRLMSDNQWRTLTEIQKAIQLDQYVSETSISARLRDLRKKKFGGYTLDSRRRGEASRGLFEYRVTI